MASGNLSLTHSFSGHRHQFLTNGKLAKEYTGKIKVAKLNVDQNQQVASQYGVSSIPTLILFKNGKESGKMLGLQSKDALKKMVNAAL